MTREKSLLQSPRKVFSTRSAYLTKDTSKNTRTYEFWYKDAVAALNGDVALDALFDRIVVPTSITNAQLATIEGMTITVNAYAIQADGFANAEAAWAAYGK